MECGVETVSGSAISAPATTATTFVRGGYLAISAAGFFNALDVCSCAGDQGHPIGGVPTSEDSNRIVWSRCLIVAYGSARRMAGVS